MPLSPKRSSRSARSRSSSGSSSNSSRSGSSSSSDSSDSDDEKNKKNSPKELKKHENEKVVSSKAADELKDDNTSNEEADQPPPAPFRKNRDMVTGGPSGGRTGGVYVPPFKLAMMMKAMGASDKSSEENQKLSWEALRKSINGLINKVNVANMKDIIPELFQENLVRGRGLFARAIMKAQLASPGFTHIYSALLAIVNTKLPENGELVLKRVIYGFKRAYKRRDKITATALSKFIAHLVNHQIAHEILSLQLLTILLEEPTDDSVEIAVNFVKEVGQLLEELSPQGLHAIFERFRGILHEGDIDKRVQYTIEGLFAIRKSGFKDYPAIPKELDLVEREDQITFEIGTVDSNHKISFDVYIASCYHAYF